MAPIRSTSQPFNGSIRAKASRYPLVTHWIVESALCSSIASVGSETFTTVVSNWDRNDPNTATEAIFQMPDGSVDDACSVIVSVLTK